MPTRMRVVGKEQLVRAIEAGDVPAVAARAWLAEATEAQWAGPNDVRNAYNDAEEVDDFTILLPLDDVGHCVVILVDYRCRVVLVTHAGRKGKYQMRKRQAGGRS